MITLTDGTKTVEFTKKEMENIEDGLREIKWADARAGVPNTIIDVVLAKLEGLNYE